MRRRIGALAALALLAAGCGGSGSSGSGSANGSPDTLRVIQAAAARTAAETSMRISGHMSEKLDQVSVRPGTAPVSVDMSVSMAGVLQTKPLLARMTLTGISTGGQTVPGDMTELITPSAFYLQMPALAAKLGKPWVEMKFSDLKSASGVDLKQLMSQAQQMQPGQYIQQLAAAGDVREVGHETVNGIATTHYAGSVSIDAALAHYSSSLRAQMAPLMQSAGFTATHVDAWLDSKGLVRRIRTSSVGGKGAIDLTMDVLDYGLSVNVTPPPASETVDLGKLAGGLGG